ncbi:hypothetical protein GCM10022215_22160 [Nocardioides fonticola]|uniref:G domain-containing protein n=1 Tax=Nocardioides fonticola TaxID=450363 RepID=A0ABP7XJE4_9ACTN
MTSLQEATTSLVTRGTDLAGRIEGLAAAVDGARGRLADADLDRAATVVSRAAGRMRLSSDHTVVAIAGATGSGKSSTFNALTGLELSAVGVRRPTTSWATACVWGADGAAELLEWLGIPPRHQTTRDSMLDTRRESNSMDGVVLLDLPDHDSTEVAHHLEVDRLVGLADMIIWVLDPQKYADAAIHDRYLAPMRSHADIMLVVLNHIDTVAEDRRQSMLDDVRRLLDADGLTEVPVLGVSARHGLGLDELRARIERRVADKQLTRDRVEADLRALADDLVALDGAADAAGLNTARITTFDAALADAAGIPVIVDAVERSSLGRIRRAVGWPPLAWLGRLRPDPLKGLDLDLGSAGRALAGADRSAPSAVGLERGRLDAEVRALVDDAGRGLGTGWQESLRRIGLAPLDTLGEQLDRAVAGVDLGARTVPGWARGVMLLQWLLLLAAVGGIAWAVAASEPLGYALAGAGLVLGVLLAIIARGRAASAATETAETADRALRAAVREVAHARVVAPLQAELEVRAGVRAGLERARR